MYGTKGGECRMKEYTQHEEMQFGAKPKVVAKPKAKLIGADGNIFNLIGIASRALRKAGQEDKAKEMQERIDNEADSYDRALAIITDYVSVY